MRWLLFAVTLPWTLTIGWGWVLLMASIFACKNLRFEPTGVLTAVWRPWATKIWKYSTTLGTGIIYQPETRAYQGKPWTSVQRHEHVHVRQVQDQMFLSLVVGLSVLLTVGFSTGRWEVASVLGGVLWWSGGLWQVTNFLTAGARHGWCLRGVYNGSEHELSAYSQTSRRGRESGLSWLEEWLAETSQEKES